MTKSLLVAFLSIFMLNTAIYSGDDIEEGRPGKRKRNLEPNSNAEQQTGLDRYSISTVTPEYQEKIERVLLERNIPFSQDTFADNKISGEFLSHLLGGDVPDSIAYGDSGGKNNFNSSIGKYCPPTPRAGYYEFTDRDGQKVYWKKSTP